MLDIVIEFVWNKLQNTQENIGYDTFSTTLLISPYQNHDALKQIGEELAQKYNLKFLYRDFRPGFREGQDAAREL